MSPGKSAPRKGSPVESGDWSDMMTIMIEGGIRMRGEPEAAMVPVAMGFE